MKINYGFIAVLIVIMAAVAGGAYTLGTQHAAQDQADEQIASADSSKQTASPIRAGTRMPANHPSLPYGGNDMAGASNIKFTRYRVGRLNIKGIYADGRDVWVGTSGGLIRYNTQTNDFKVFNNKTPGILSNGVFFVSKLNDNILLGTYGGGMSAMNIKTGKWRNYNIPDGLADQFVYDVAKAPNGDVWIATWSGANRVKGGHFDDPKAWTMYTVENTHHGLPNPWVYGVEVGKNGDMWFATEMGLARFKDGKWTHWSHKDGLGADYDLVKDEIAATPDPSAVSSHHMHVKKSEGLGNIGVAYNPNYIISLAVDGDGTVWAGTWGAGLARFDGKKWRNFTTADGLPGNHIFMLYLDPKGRLWIGTDHGLSRLKKDGKGFTTMTAADGLYADDVFSMDFAKDGSVWVGSFGGLSHITSKL